MGLTKSRMTLLVAATLAVGFSACVGDDPQLPSSNDDDKLDASTSDTSMSDGTTTPNDGDADGDAPVDPKCPPGTTTTISGTVYDPAGAFPVEGVRVFVPGSTPEPMPTGISCDLCKAPPGALASTKTGADGKFVLQATPAGKVPVVFQIGKWRRQIVVDNVVECADTPLTDKDQTRLPRKKSEGDMPRIALTTGAADPLECVLRKIGIDDSEFTTNAVDGRVHLYKGPGSPTGAFSAALGGANFTGAASLWNDVNALKKYDLVLLACEGGPNEASKSLAAREAMFDYANAGGRIFAFHDQAYWFSAGPAPFPSAASWVTNRAKPPEPLIASLDTSSPQTTAMRDWAQNVGALSAGGVSIYGAQHNVDGTGGVSRPWITFTNPNASNVAGIGLLTFETPVGAAGTKQCGRVAHAAMHVAFGDSSGPAFPTGCTSATISPQEKLVEYMLFHLSNCLE